MKKGRFLGPGPLRGKYTFWDSNRCGMVPGCYCEYSGAPGHSVACLGASCGHLPPPAPRSELREASEPCLPGAKANRENHGNSMKIHENRDLQFWSISGNSSTFRRFYANVSVSNLRLLGTLWRASGRVAATYRIQRASGGFGAGSDSSKNNENQRK